MKLCHMRHSPRIFLFRRKVMFRSRDIQVFVFYTIAWFAKICEVMISISTWDRVHFWMYLLKHYSLSHQTRPIDRHKQGKYFSRIFWTILRTGARFQVLFNLVPCCNYSITNYVKIAVFHFLIAFRIQKK